MINDIEIGGRRRRVELERTGEGWKATVDGVRTSVDAVPTPTGWSLVLGPGDGGHQAPHPAGVDEDGTALAAGASRSVYDVSIDVRGPGALTIVVNGQAIEAQVSDPRVYRRHRGAGPGGSGPRQVVAPMPGRVVKVLVENGETVSARQGLIVVEAMKMENELRAPGDAVVRDVRVAEGTLVEAGTVLVVLE